MGPLQSRCKSCVKRRAKAKETAKKERLKVKRQKYKERPAALKKKLDIVFSKYIRLRDKGKPCVTCGAPWTPSDQCGHFQSRRHFATRWDEWNAHSQCCKCNMWGAGEQFLHAQAIDKMYMPGVAEGLMHQATLPWFKLTPDFLHERLSHFTKKLQDLEALQEVR